MNDGLLTRAECAALRGLAIIGIFLHNYCHWLGPVVKENEYTFSQHNVDWLTAVMASPDGLLPAHLVSFFGHYGVPVFLFLSAYGLELKYGRSLYAPAFRFVAYHWKKLFSMMIVGFVSFTIVDAMTPGRWHYTLTQVVAQLAMVNNLLPDPDHNIWPGPFWFFGLMLQLYVVYRLLLYKRTGRGPRAPWWCAWACSWPSPPRARRSTGTATTLWAACCPSASDCSTPATATASS